MQAVTCERDGAVATITLARTTVDREVAEGLIAAAEECAWEERAAVVVVRSSGSAYCAAADSSSAGLDWSGAIAALPVPVIAALHADATAEGAELALCCDLRVARRSAAMRFSQIACGRLPQHGATQRLTRSVGRMRALEILLSGRRVKAGEALRIGLCNEVFSGGDWDAWVDSYAKTLAQRAPIALRYAKEAVRRGSEMSLDDGIRLEQDLYALLQTTGDRAEGVAAFLDRRTPRFRGN